MAFGPCLSKQLFAHLKQQKVARKTIQDHMLFPTKVKPKADEWLTERGEREEARLSAAAYFSPPKNVLCEKRGAVRGLVTQPGLEQGDFPYSPITSPTQTSRKTQKLRSLRCHMRPRLWRYTTQKGHTSNIKM